MKTKVSYANCSIFVVGMDMDCPLCGALVRSGEHHNCSGRQFAIESAKKLAIPPELLIGRKGQGNYAAALAASQELPKSRLVKNKKRGAGKLPSPNR
jgi:hypothetical protein